MRLWARRFLLLLCALALVSGSSMSFAAMPASAIATSPADAHPCGGSEHDAAPDTKPHKDHGSRCLSCCLGACAAIPAVPDRSSVTTVLFAASTIRYWQTDRFLPSRSIAPDPGPPRTSA